LDGAFGLAGLEQSPALARPEVFDTDQDVQFTANAFTTSLQDARVCSMGGRGRVGDNIFCQKGAFSIVRAQGSQPKRVILRLSKGYFFV
jgi:hypothetical protein